jgi:hypothetical protein
VTFWLAACRQTGVRDIKATQAKNLPKPSRILDYDFAVNEREVTEYQGIMRQQPSLKDPVERERMIATEAKDALTSEVVDGLRALGFAVERATHGTRAARSELLIGGQGHPETIQEVKLILMEHAKHFPASTTVACRRSASDDPAPAFDARGYDYACLPETFSPS